MAAVHLPGVWLHYPEDPAGSSWHFRYNGDGAEESLSQEQVATRVAGRARPIIDFGQAIAEQVAVTISCDGDTRDLAVLKAFVRAQRVVCYRDGQGRKYVGTLALSKLTDQFWGAEADITITTVDDVRNDLPVVAATAAEAGNA
jgi:hypothetical protein